MGKEFELKFAADPEKQARILQDFGDFTDISMETTYYDTESRDFSHRKLTLRRRLENGVSVCTLKAPAGPHCRREFEVEAPSMEAAIPMLCKLSQWEELPALTQKGIYPLCGARFIRRAKRLVLPECIVEIAVDAGCLTGGGETTPLCEVEVELKEGSEEATARFANTLARHYDLRPEPKSKFHRAAELAAQTKRKG